MTDPRDHDGPIPVITMAEMRTEVRADVYLLSGRRRRAVFGDGGR